MAAISQKVSSDEVLPLVARNIVIAGYSGSGRSRKPTEYLTLVKRYLQQAKELEELAGPEHVIRFSNCDDAQPLLKVIGYHLRQACGPDTSLETADSERAFITIDSGFPVAPLEEAVREGKPFAHPYVSTQVPVMFGRSDWLSNGLDDVVNSLLRDPDMARLYWALSRLDPSTRDFLRKYPGLQPLIPLGPVLDFYGRNLCIRSGRVAVPGGHRSEGAWKTLVGASSASPADFITRLLAKDQGWLAAYFDALSRIDGAQQAYFTEPRRLQRFYLALRGRDTAPGAARSVFRPNAGLLLLVTRLQFEANGQPHIPGNVEVWKTLVPRRSESKVVRGWAKRAAQWSRPDQIIEGMFAFSRADYEESPLRIFLTLSEIDRSRPSNQRLSPQTVSLMAEKYARFKDQYTVFAEFHALNDAAISSFLSEAEALDRIHEPMLRSDALGLFQANLGLWQIFARQGQIPVGNWTDSWQRVIHPFGAVGTSAQLFDAARDSFRELMQAAAGRPDLSQDGVIALLAGPSQSTPEGQRVRQELANRIRSVLEAQRLTSLDTLFGLGEGLTQTAQAKASPASLLRMASELQEFEMPKPLFTNQERIEWASGLYNNPHTRLQTQVALTRIIKSPASPARLAEARGQVAPFLRDTLVGLNYAYYEPPGAQMLLNNPLFVRSHDFAGEMTTKREGAWQTPSVVGRGWTASGGAHLAGSLADLPYVLAQVEQDFIVPENVQSLIWGDLVPCLLTSAVMTRWWRVTGNELHAVALYQRFGEELVTTASTDEKLREEVMIILSHRMLPPRAELVDEALRAGNSKQALANLAPAETFYLAAEYRRKLPEQAGHAGKSGEELAKLAQLYPQEVSWERISEDFGVPHPALLETYSRELLNVRPFPTFLGYSSRLLAETWDSNNLYWARLADEMGYSPVILHQMVPELTHRMVEKIFATDLEDWPALLRALRETGEEFRQGKVAALDKGSPGPGRLGKHSIKAIPRNVR